MLLYPRILTIHLGTANGNITAIFPAPANPDHQPTAVCSTSSWDYYRRDEVETVLANYQTVEKKYGIQVTWTIRKIIVKDAAEHLRLFHAFPF